MLKSAFLHVKIDVSDLKRSLEFYAGCLGLKEIVRYDRSDGVVIVQLSPTGAPPGLELWYEPPHRAAPNERFHVAFGVQDVDAAIRFLDLQGVVVVQTPFRIGHEIIAFVRDPDGYLVELNQDTLASQVADQAPDQLR
jgi:lactoylglutathione lyase